jgi:hypothetical protein
MSQFAENLSNKPLPVELMKRALLFRRLGPTLIETAQNQSVTCMVHFFYIGPRAYFLEPIATTRRSVSAAHRKFLGVSYVTIRANLETTYRATLEHVARRPEFQFFRFWGRESETPRTRRVISEPSRADTRENLLHFRHLGKGQFRFGTRSGSGQVRAVLICCTSWVFIMCRQDQQQH